MIVVTIRLVGRRGTVEREAVVDTGFTGGLLLPKAAARKLGAALVRPKRLPRTLSGSVIHGLSTVLRVEIPRTKACAETIAFCPDATPAQTLLGAHFLGQVQAVLKIGAVTHEFTRPTPPGLDLYDLGDWVVPLDRPVGPWFWPDGTQLGPWPARGASTAPRDAVARRSRS
jgi:predicted aspartyl protease